MPTLPAVSCRWFCSAGAPRGWGASLSLSSGRDSQFPRSHICDLALTQLGAPSPVLGGHWGWRGKGKEVQSAAKDSQAVMLPPHATNPPPNGSSGPWLTQQARPSPTNQKHPRCSGQGAGAQGPACAQSSVWGSRIPSALPPSPAPARPGRAPRLPDSRSAVAGLLTAGEKHFPKIAALRGRAALEFDPDGHPRGLAWAPGPAQPHLTVTITQGLPVGVGPGFSSLPHPLPLPVCSFSSALSLESR